MDNCLFCKMIKGEIPVNPVYTDENLIAINDIHPQAPTHTLIIPRKHIKTINDLEEEDTLLVGQMIQTAKHLAMHWNFSDDGYRLVFNCNSGGGQAVFHIHLHLLGGRQMQWPPG